jgi:hypothetical protein
MIRAGRTAAVARQHAPLGIQASEPEGMQVLYEYDFGDGLAARACSGRSFARRQIVPAAVCGGERHCPPEDCGGSQGFFETLEAFQGANHPEHCDVVEWLGEDFAPEFFASEEINRRLRRRKH